MAGYKQPCIYCHSFIPREANFCLHCGASFPFGSRCPGCLHAVDKKQSFCSGCGRPLYLPCPFCSQETFVGDRCEACGKSLLVPCHNPRCDGWLFFQNRKCTACGKRLP